MELFFFLELFLLELFEEEEAVGVGLAVERFTATLYEPLFLTRTPDFTPAARPAFRKRFLSGATLRYFLIAWRLEPVRSLRARMAPLAWSEEERERGGGGEV